MCHQVGSFVSILLAGILYDATGSYFLPFAIAGLLLFPAALAAFMIDEKKYSVRYQSIRRGHRLGISGGLAEFPNANGSVRMDSWFASA